MTNKEKMNKIIKILGNTIDYDDDTKQDVFIKIHTKINLKNYTHHTLLSLVRKMLKNQNLDNLKKENKYYNESDLTETDIFRTLIAEEYEDKGEEVMMLKNALKMLTENDREIFKLVLEGKKNKEIAEIMGKELNTIKSMRKRGIEKIKKIMQNK